MKLKKIISLSLCLILVVVITASASSKVDSLAQLKKQVSQLKTQITLLNKINKSLQSSNDILIEDKSKALQDVTDLLKQMHSTISQKDEIMSGFQAKAISQENIIKDLLVRLNSPSPVTPTVTGIITNTGYNSNPDTTTQTTLTNGNGEQLILVNADPAKGFNYAYYLYIPSGVDKTKPIRLIVEPNNNGRPNDDQSIFDKNAKEIASLYNGHNIAVSLKIPILVPAFPRPMEAYTHDLGRTTILISSGSLKRIDLQLVAMIKDAQKSMKLVDITVQDKVFLNGFSASSHFANRFALMHPEIVRAVATGGINSLPIIPAASIQETKLRFPIGIADLKDITGIDFNMNEYKKISQFIFMGGNDTNDTAKAGDCFEDQDRTVIYSLLGEKMVPDRFTKIQEIFKQFELPIQFHTYQGIGHELPGYLWTDLNSFFSANMGDEMKIINAHE